MRRIIPFMLLTAGLHAAIEQSVFTTNKLVIGTGITNDAGTVKANVAPGTNVVFTTN